MMKTRTLAFALAGAVLAPAGLASAATLHYDANQSYLSMNDSPFYNFSNNQNVTWFMEDFEDGLLNSLGVSADGGSVFNGSETVDSVDMDDGSMDGMGNEGMSYKHAGSEGQMLTLTFDANDLGGHLPTRVGFAWTDGHPDALVVFEAFDAANNSLGSISTTLGDAYNSGQTPEDRFFGIAFNGGIARIEIFHEFGGMEIDHLQYGMAGSLIPLPPAAALGFAGLGLIAYRRRRQKTA
ncbi:MAG: hypothetical protein ACYTJ0_17465 [Planctomycetota bacterium]|jgi:hypothetical protein